MGLGARNRTQKLCACNWRTIRKLQATGASTRAEVWIPWAMPLAAGRECGFPCPFDPHFHRGRPSIVAVIPLPRQARAEEHAGQDSMEKRVALGRK